MNLHCFCRGKANIDCCDAMIWGPILKKYLEIETNILNYEKVTIDTKDNIVLLFTFKKNDSFDLSDVGEKLENIFEESKFYAELSQDRYKNLQKYVSLGKTFFCENRVKIQNSTFFKIN